MKSLKIGVLAFSCCILGCQEKTAYHTEEKQEAVPNEAAAEVKKIAVLNFGTFHMGFTSDATKTEFDEHDKDNQREVHLIAKKLSAFQPTVILVEIPPENNEELSREYMEYTANPEMFFENPSEIELLAYELGRLSGTKRIYGIDHKMEYNYTIGNEMVNAIDSITHNKFYQNIMSFYPENFFLQDTLDLLEKLRITNQNNFLDFMIVANADMLTHVGSKNGYEGADEAAKYYQRNLRMYSNLNRVSLDETDRVFILMGASHTAFFRDFISRSPKYKMVDTFEYLK